MQSNRTKIEQDGYVIVPGLLTHDEIGRLREGLYSHFRNSYEFEGLGKHQPNAAVEVGAIDWIFGSPAIVAVFRELYGRTDLIFTGNCDAHMNMLSWWHKDSSGCFTDECFARPECKVYRAGIYLQDHVIRDGLTVKRGSHRFKTLTEGDSETLSTRAGDVIFFDMRLTHAGKFANPLEMILMRGCRKLKLTRAITALMFSVRRLAGKTDKLSIFFTYAIPGPDAERFCNYEAAAKRQRPSEMAPYLPEAIAENLHSSGVEIWPLMARPADQTSVKP